MVIEEKKPCFLKKLDKLVIKMTLRHKNGLTNVYVLCHETIQSGQVMFNKMALKMRARSVLPHSHSVNIKAVIL